MKKHIINLNNPQYTLCRHSLQEVNYRLTNNYDDSNICRLCLKALKLRQKAALYRLSKNLSIEELEHKLQQIAQLEKNGEL